MPNPWRRPMSLKRASARSLSLSLSLPLSHSLTRTHTHTHTHTQIHKHTNTRKHTRKHKLPTLHLPPQMRLNRFRCSVPLLGTLQDKVVYRYKYRHMCVFVCVGVFVCVPTLHLPTECQRVMNYMRVQVRSDMVVECFLHECIMSLVILVSRSTAQLIA